MGKLFAVKVMNRKTGKIETVQSFKNVNQELYYKIDPTGYFVKINGIWQRIEQVNKKCI